MPAVPLPAHLQLSLDEVLLDAAIAGRRRPTLRFWEWSERALVLGSHQALVNEIDREAADALGFAVARRLSGGGTMIVEPGQTITYSLYLRAAGPLARLSFVESFAFLDGWVVDCLRDLGVPAGYRPVNDIVSPVGKIGGAAQARRRGFVLHHTAIAHAMDTSIVTRLIRVGRERVSDRGVRSAERVVSPLDRWTALSRDQVVAALANWFEQRHATALSEVTAEELAAARALARAKYATPEWIDRVR